MENKQQTFSGNIGIMIFKKTEVTLKTLQNLRTFSTMNGQEINYFSVVKG